MFVCFSVFGCETSRLGMTSPIPPVLWITLLCMWSSNTALEAYNTEVCHKEFLPMIPDVDCSESKENFSCLLSPTNILNCSWWFPTLEKDAQLSVDISICDGGIVHLLNCSSKESVGSKAMTVLAQGVLNVIARLNISLHDERTVDTKTIEYEMAMLEVLPPPDNISASIKDGGLLVTWSEPKNREDLSLHCFEFQVDLGDQEKPINLTNQLSYTGPNADPGFTYRVRIRTRRDCNCISNMIWSDWSHTVTVERTNKLSIVIIILISFGIPMILLAFLLFVRHQRVFEVLFPVIPRPPQKYKGFLEKKDTFNFFQPDPSAEPVEEITEVEDTEQNLG